MATQIEVIIVCLQVYMAIPTLSYQFVTFHHKSAKQKSKVKLWIIIL